MEIKKSKLSATITFTKEEILDWLKDSGWEEFMKNYEQEREAELERAEKDFEIQLGECPPHAV